MKIAIGCDHAGVALKKLIIQYLGKRDILALDYGCNDTQSVDYPKYAKLVAAAINEGECDLGILICGTGIGMSIAANKINGIRAALCSDSLTARLTREHNDSNILVLGARVIGDEVALDIVNTFTKTEFPSEERNVRRINLISELED